MGQTEVAIVGSGIAGLCMGIKLRQAGCEDFVILEKDGVDLADSWKQNGIGAHLGITVAGYANLFLLTGPNTGQGHSSVVFMVEAQVRYVMQALDLLRRRGATYVEVRDEVQQRSSPTSRTSSRGRSGSPAATAGTSMRRAATRRSGPTSPSATGAGPAGWIRPTSSWSAKGCPGRLRDDRSGSGLRPWDDRKTGLQADVISAGARQS